MVARLTRTNTHRGWNETIRLLLWILFFGTTSVWGVSLAMANEQLLRDRGIEPQVLDAAVSSLSQKKAFIAQLQIENSTGGETETDIAYMVFDPFAEYGIDLYLMFDRHSDAVDGFLQKTKYRDSLAKYMRVQHRLLTMGNQYDPASIQLDPDKGDSVISFGFASYGIPQDIAFFRFLRGQAFVNGNVLERIELVNEQSFMHGGSRYQNYRKVAYFTKTEDGSYLIDSYTITADGNRWGKSFRSVTKVKFIQYRDAEGHTVQLAPDMPVDFDEADFEAVRVKLDRTLPIWGKEIRKRGFDLPLPVGIQGIYRYQEDNIDFTSFTIDGSSDFELIFDPQGSGADVYTNMGGLRADLYVLPFLNFSAFVGKAKSNADLKIKTTDEFRDFIDWTGGDMPEFIDLNLDLNVNLAGVGMTTALGYKDIFGSLTASYAQSVTEGAGTSTNIWTLNPIAGYQFPEYRLRLLVGAEYVGINSEMLGTIEMEDGSQFDFNIGVTTNEWSGVLGIHKEFGSHMEFVLMYGRGEDRESFTATLGYRH